MKLFFILFSLFVFFHCSKVKDKEAPIINPMPTKAFLEFPVSSANLVDSLSQSADEAHWYFKSDLHLDHPRESAVYHSKYSEVISEVTSTRTQLKSILDADTSSRDSIIEVAQSYLFNKLTNDVLPFWYGTPWDFNGISNVPGQGQIACGYFISTPLKHIGFNLNRYRVAQKGATQIIHTISGKEETITFKDRSKLEDYLKKRPDGLYVIGLSSHVGFIEKRGELLYFTHSNYLSPAQVIREDLSTSPAINSSGIYVLGSLTLSKKAILTWINETLVKV